jgi:L-ascorbate metabolism protein UlaG (beta-lactamase superfamily)
MAALYHGGLVRVLLISLLCAGCCEFSGPRWRGRVTDHFDGQTFHNQVPGEPSLSDFARWGRSRIPGKWPDYADAPPAPPPPERVGKGELRITFVNHATVLVQVDGVNLLTDPIWGEVAGPVPYIARKRRRPPGLRFEDLPPIDAVLISHDHYDHMDIPTLHRLEAAHHPRFIAGLGQAALLDTFGITRVTELDWWQWTGVGSLRIWGVPARHTCRRGACDRNGRLWLGFVIRSPAGNVYFAGDTGYGPHFQEIAERFGPTRLALLPIAPGLPRKLFASVHLDARDAAIAARALRAEVSIPIHFGTFAQGDESDGEAEAKLREALREPGSARFVILKNGGSFTSSPAAGGS